MWLPRAGTRACPYITVETPPADHKQTANLTYLIFTRFALCTSRGSRTIFRESFNIVYKMEGIRLAYVPSTPSTTAYPTTAPPDCKRQNRPQHRRPDTTAIALE